MSMYIFRRVDVQQPLYQLTIRCRRGESISHDRDLMRVFVCSCEVYHDTLMQVICLHARCHMIATHFSTCVLFADRLIR